MNFLPIWIILGRCSWAFKFENIFFFWSQFFGRNIGHDHWSHSLIIYYWYSWRHHLSNTDYIRKGLVNLNRSRIWVSQRRRIYINRGGGAGLVWIKGRFYYRTSSCLLIRTRILGRNNIVLSW